MIAWIRNLLREPDRIHPRDTQDQAEALEGAPADIVVESGAGGLFDDVPGNPGAQRALGRALSRKRVNRIHYPGPGVPWRYDVPKHNLVKAAERALQRD